MLLLHGAPQSRVSWAAVARELARDYTVVVADLRGYGDSGKIEGDPEHNFYSKRTMALDQVEVMRHFGFERFSVFGHDRGGRVTHRMALDHPEKVERAAVLDIIPTHYLFSRVDKAFAESAYHWFFFARPAPFPETVILNSLELFVGREDQTLGAEYRRVFRIPGTLHAMCEDYRAGIDRFRARRGGLGLEGPVPAAGAVGRARLRRAALRRARDLGRARGARLRQADAGRAFVSGIPPARRRPPSCARSWRARQYDGATNLRAVLDTV